MTDEVVDQITAMFYHSDFDLQTFIKEMTAAMSRLVRTEALENPESAILLLRALEDWPEQMKVDIEKLIPDLRKRMREGT